MGEFVHGEQEPQRDMTLNLDLFLADCYHRSDSPTELLASLERLIQTELGLDSNESDKLSHVLDVCGMLPDFALFEANPSKALELFGLAPLRFLGPYMEMTCTADEMEQWYRKAAAVALELAPNHTNDRCINITGSLAELDCEQGVFCPRRVVRSLLVLPSRMNDFHDAPYVYDPALHNTEIETKVHIAVENGLLHRSSATTILDIRRRQYGRSALSRPETE